MRVAYVCRGVFISGAERSLQTILRNAPGAGIEPVVIGLPDDRMAPWCQEHGVPFAGCRQVLRDKWWPFTWWNSVGTMRSLLRSLKVDLVHTNQIWSYPIVGAAAGKLGLPRVCHMRDEMPADGVRWWCSAGVELVLCISQHIEHMVKPAFLNRAASRVQTLLNPVTIPPLPTEEQRQLSRAALGLPETAVIFGFIGQIIPVKGLSLLLDSLAEMASDPRWHLAIAGQDPNPGDPHESHCRQRIRELGLEGRVTFLGFLEDTAPFYHAIDAVVVPSLKEPLGRVPLEAAAYAKPAIAFAAGGLPETVRHGKTGWLVPPGERAALRDSLTRFLDHPEKEIGLEARAWVESVADPRRYVSRLAELYTGLLR